MRKCPRCKIEFSDIHYLSSKFNKWCKSCRKIYNKQYRESDVGYWRQRESCWKTGGIKNSDGSWFKYANYLSWMDSQHDSCAVCKNTHNNGKSWCVDHNHDTGVVRGILCERCNHVLGHCKDNVETLKLAIEYLNRGFI